MAPTCAVASEVTTFQLTIALQPYQRYSSIARITAAVVFVHKCQPICGLILLEQELLLL